MVGVAASKTVRTMFIAMPASLCVHSPRHLLHTPHLMPVALVPIMLDRKPLISILKSIRKTRLSTSRTSFSIIKTSIKLDHISTTVPQVLTVTYSRLQTYKTYKSPRQPI
jgi:hypothetical protein